MTPQRRLGRLLTVSTAALLALVLVGPGIATAANPGWDILYTKLPTVVKAGNDAGYAVTIQNKGRSNINALTFTATALSTPTAGPSYFSGLTWNQGGPGSCTNTGPGGPGPLTCNLGTVTAGTNITFTVAFDVPVGATGTFDVKLEISSASGNTGSDTGGNSRGDAFSRTAQTGISNSVNFDAGFVVGDGTFDTTGTLGRQNKQITSLQTTDSLIPVTVQDGIASYPCSSAIPQCSRLLGEWSVLDVNGGTNSAPIKVTLLIWGGSVPGGVGVDDIYLVHANGSGGATPVTADCNASPPTNADCIESVIKVGSNFKVVAWLAQNGGLRGGY